MTKRAQQRYIAAFAIFFYHKVQHTIVYINCLELRAISMQPVNSVTCTYKKSIYKSLRTINRQKQIDVF